MCSRFRTRLKLEHEWIAPFNVTVEDKHFTVSELFDKSCFRFTRSLFSDSSFIFLHPFQAAARVLLLTFVIMSQMFVEALLYDVSHPDAGGTCSINILTKSMSNVTNTSSFTYRYNMTAFPNGTNITSSIIVDSQNHTVGNHVTYTSNFPSLEAPLTFLEKIMLAAIASVLTIPLTVLCFTSLITLAMGKKNERLWEKFGTQDLG